MAGNANATNLLNMLNTFCAVVSEGTTAYTLLSAAHDRVAKIVAEGRDPTPQEWDDLNREISSLHQQLQS